MSEQQPVEPISIRELRDRLKGKMSDDEVDELLESYGESLKEKLPDIERINEIAKKRTEPRHLKVQFTLTPVQYDAISKLLGEEGSQGTNLVIKILENFIEENI